MSKSRVTTTECTGHRRQWQCDGSADGDCGADDLERRKDHGWTSRHRVTAKIRKTNRRRGHFEDSTDGESGADDVTLRLDGETVTLTEFTRTTIGRSTGDLRLDGGRRDCDNTHGEHRPDDLTLSLDGERVTLTEDLSRITTVRSTGGLPLDRGLTRVRLDYYNGTQELKRTSLRRRTGRVRLHVCQPPSRKSK